MVAALIWSTYYKLALCCCFQSKRPPRLMEESQPTFSGGRMEIVSGSTFALLPLSLPLSLDLAQQRCERRRRYELLYSTMCRCQIPSYPPISAPHTLAVAEHLLPTVTEQEHSVETPVLQALIPGSRGRSARSTASPRPIPRLEGKKRYCQTPPGKGEREHKVFAQEGVVARLGLEPRQSLVMLCGRFGEA